MIGRTISQYRVLERLGKGGMGEVYLAEDTRVGHRVAIKVLPRRLADDPAAKARFLREARAVAQLDHPYILPLHEFDEHEGDLYFVTAYQAGGSLRDVLRAAAGQAIPLEKVLRWGVQAAEGLAAAHKRGVIHRDIKPDNLLLTEDGDLRICDFGLASIADATRITHSGAMMGTLGYMSPEQVRGKTVDRCSDLFSLGATLYELLAGRAPFSGGDQAAALHAIAYDEATPLTEVRTDLPSELVTLVEQLLQKEAGDRLCSAEEAAARLRVVATSLATSETLPLPAFAEDGPAVPTNRLLWTVLALLVVVVGGWVSWRLITSDPSPPDAVTLAPDEAQLEEDRTVRFAVLPFAVQGGETVQGLADGMIELLSTRLHGAGALRRPDAGAEKGEAGEDDESPIEDWPADFAGARSQASRGGIALLVRGAVVEAAGQLHVSAELFETDSSAPPTAEAAVEGPIEDLHRLLDELSIELLLARVRSTGELPFDVASVQTKSLPALKAYLEGEWVAGNWNSIDAYERAVEADPAFAMAWLRMARTRIPPMTDYDRAREAIANALEFSEQLTSDTLLHARAVEAFIQGDALRVEDLCRAVISNDPDNVQAWWLLEATYRLIGWKHGMRITEALPALERLEELGENVDWILSGMHSWKQGIESPEERILRSPSKVVRVLGSGREAAVDSLVAEWRQWPSWILLRELMRSSRPRDVPVAMEQIVGVLTEDSRSADIQSYGHVILGNLLVERGRWRDAQKEFQIARELDFPLAIEHEALLAASPFLPVPESDLRELRDELARWDVGAVTPGSDETRWVRIHDDHHAHLKLYLMGLLSARLGELESALGFAQELQQLPGSPHVNGLAEDLAHGIRGWVLWQQDRPAEALAELERARFPADPDFFFYSPFHIQSMERYLRAEVLLELGRFEDALGWYPNPWSWGLEYVYLAPYHLRHAQIYNELGDRELALKHYARFLEYWGECETELQPVVDDARAEMQRIQTESASEAGG